MQLSNDTSKNSTSHPYLVKNERSLTYTFKEGVFYFERQEFFNFLPDLLLYFLSLASSSSSLLSLSQLSSPLSPHYSHTLVCICSILPLCSLITFVDSS